MSDLVTVALISAVAPVLTVIVAAWSMFRKLDAIHVLANSRLTEALQKIAKLERLLGEASPRKQKQKPRGRI